MGLFSKYESYCANCNKPTNGKILCRDCNKQSDQTVYYCGECGEEFFRSEVIFCGYTNSGYMCKDCYND